MLGPALVGAAVLTAAVAVAGLVLWRARLARAVGSALGRAWSALRRLVRRPPVTTWGEAAVRFRLQTIDLLARRWPALTASTIVSHLALYLVLLLALRHVGVSEHEVSWAEVLAVFAGARLVSAVPVTPGGVGLVELALIGGLVVAGEGRADVSGDLFRAQVAAAALVFRALTYALQIPMGALTYLVWRQKRGWRRSPADRSRSQAAGRPPGAPEQGTG